MLERLSQSSGNAVGYKVTGRLTKEDFATVTADVEALVQQEGTIRLLLDLEAFKGEKLKTLGSYRQFRRDHRINIAKMAVVGGTKWREWLLAIVNRPYYDQETRFYPADQRDAAWEWLRT